MVNSDIVGFYRDRSIFITGATGFMGKVLVEKLLRCCPGIKNLYLLMRPKAGNDIRTRLEELISTKVFDNLRRDSPELLNKLVPIAGDMSLPSLGVSPSDIKMLSDNVSIVFHSAATVKFDEALKSAVEMNLKGTMRLIELVRKMDRLEALVHVSTAYANCDKDEIAEMIYPPPADPHKLMECVDWMDEELLKGITKKLIGKRPNTYTYTKALAEHLLLEECGGIPLAIVRPTIVTAAMKEPIPGWVDNLNGPTGLIAGAGKGLLRTLWCHTTMVADVIPVEFPINLMIAVAWHTATYKPNNIVVYNCASGYHNPLTWGQIESLGRVALLKYPMSEVMWYPSGSFKSNLTLHKIDVVLYHYLPAYFLDFLARLSGKPPMLVRLYDKAHRAMSCLNYFTTHEWRFISENPIHLLEKMSPEDRRIFYFDVRTIDWASYLETYALGTRRFILKDDPSTLPAARRHLTRMFWIQQISRVAVLLLFWRAVVSRSETARRVWNLAFTMLVSMMRRLSAGAGIGIAK
ncbi:putative fatty acyl-CoA reductase CG5065 [Daphnia carinata]|uniref:putative fatty acyl-CoA reductase CG5065 n=1 Tax=Daphnia carinata TaxID=120202 RepID=UPI002580D51C|nr:putative fatty acyl-CoA reductase CG5065 [Daphnia carinata]XP_057366399.1 putative fatty acyl-CoA reductase CG5065 [Daphnia carinata]